MSAPKTWSECADEVDRTLKRAVADVPIKDPSILAIFDRETLRQMAIGQLYMLALEREQRPTACGGAQTPLSGHPGTCEPHADSFAERPAAEADGRDGSQPTPANNIGSDDDPMNVNRSDRPAGLKLTNRMAYAKASAQPNAGIGSDFDELPIIYERHP